MSKLLRQQSGHAFLHFVLARAVEGIFSQGCRALSAGGSKWVPSRSPIVKPDVNDAMTAELHNEKNQPNLKSDRHIGIPLDQFTDEAYEGLAAGSEEVAVGAGLDWHKKIEPARQEIFQAMHQAMQKG